MGLKILCSGFLVRYPLGGFSWHHLQYLVGLQRLGHDVAYLEHFGWANSCYDPARNEMTSDSAYGRAYLCRLLQRHDLLDRWCYVDESGTSYGWTRERLADFCRSCDLYLNISNINNVEETRYCRRRVLIDTDPVFTQIKAHGLGGAFQDYHRLFTYGENVHQNRSSMPTAGARWHATRQPVVLDLWAETPGPADGRLTTLMNWSAYGDHEHDGRVFGQKDREFVPYFDFPRQTGENMELAVSPPGEVRDRLLRGGWHIADPLHVARTPDDYQAYLRQSCGEFSVAKHGYVTTRSGWFSDRSAGYLASGRPVILQDTGFTDILPIGSGLLAFRTPDEAAKSIREIRRDYDQHGRAARRIAQQYFDSSRVLGDLLEKSLT